MSATDEDLPAATNDTASTGAAADSAGGSEHIERLPRVLRYAMLFVNEAGYIDQRLIAEINELCPDLAQNSAWASTRDRETGLALAAELDRRAVTQDQPILRSFADCVRLVCLPVPRDAAGFEEHRRVGKALVHAFRAASQFTEEALCCDLEEFTFGWAAIPACTDLCQTGKSAAENAAFLGNRMAKHRVSAAASEVRQEIKEEEERRKKREAEQAPTTLKQHSSTETDAIVHNHLVVARLSAEEMKNPKLADILRPIQGAINTPLPLVTAPPLHLVRSSLLFEFPYAFGAIDFALADLVGRVTVRLRPLLLVGDPGGGKSRFARRLGETLGVSVWRADASQADGAVFGGTAKRWYSAEPCHPFLAIAQGRIANPLVIIDEIEKAGTRSDYGRLWDCSLGFLEIETSARYPDPGLQTNVDLSHVTFVATANSLDPLPSPIRDRFRIVTFPKPAAGDLDALLPAVIVDLARERGLDQIWISPLDGLEYAAVAQLWRGGSVRRLRRVVEAILHERDVRAARN